MLRFIKRSDITDVKSHKEYLVATMYFNKIFSEKTYRLILVSAVISLPFLLTPSCSENQTAITTKDELIPEIFTEMTDLYQDGYNDKDVFDTDLKTTSDTTEPEDIQANNDTYIIGDTSEESDDYSPLDTEPDYKDITPDEEYKDIFQVDNEAGSDTEVITDTFFNICPENMANIEGKFCIDMFEARLEEFLNGEWVPRSPYITVGNSTVRAVPANNSYPQAYISGKEAETACKNSGKRLCTLSEWLTACKGPYNWTYPYGNQYEKDFCNDTYISGHHPLCDYFKLNPCDPSKLSYQQFNDPGINQMPDTISRGGEFGLCVSYYGVYDMHGNLHEWISDPNGTFKGGFYGDAKINGNGCNYTTTAHEFTYHDYSTGFRCCKDIN